MNKGVWKRFMEFSFQMTKELLGDIMKVQKSSTEGL